MSHFYIYLTLSILAFCAILALVWVLWKKRTTLRQPTRLATVTPTQPTPGIPLAREADVAQVSST